MTFEERLPYPGLRAYLRSETDLFFGRESCTDEMVDRLAATRFLAVLGSSGSGKSSLVRTGLLDALELGLHAQAGWNWRIAEFTPGDSPMRNLATALLATVGLSEAELETDVLLGQLEHSPFAAVHWAREHLAPGENLLLLVDQFEELFRYGDYAQREEAEAFVALLLESVASDAPINVVVTMRSEYLGACALLPGLSERINEGLYLTRRMTREECREAIEGPASVTGFTIEPALVTRLLNDLATLAPWESDRDISQLERLSRRADQLPLMQHVLNRLWLRARERDGQVTLTLADYLEIGELRGALDLHGAEVLTRLGPKGVEIAEPVFRGLIAGTSIANAVRRPSRFGDIVRLTGLAPEEVRRVVDAFRAPDCCFLRPTLPAQVDESTIIDISHESLVRQWSLLSDWLRQETEDGARWRQYASEADAYAKGRADPMSETNLATASAWLDVVKPTEAWAQRHGGNHAEVLRFINASRQTVEARRAESLRHRRAMRSLRVGVFGLVTALGLLAGGGWFYQRGMIVERDEANEKLAATVTDLDQANQVLAATVTDLDNANKTLEERGRQIAMANGQLEDFYRHSVSLITRFSTTLWDIQEDGVIGFTKHERNLLEVLEPFQSFALQARPDLLTPAQMIHTRYTFSRSLDSRGDPRSVEELKTAYDLARDEIEKSRDPAQLGDDFLVTFFNIVVYHSWNLMNAGKYDEASLVLRQSASVEAALGDDFGGAEFASALSRVENARARWLDDRNLESEAWDSQQRVIRLMERAVTLDPDDASNVRSLIVYRNNGEIQARNLASTLDQIDPDQAKALRKEAEDIGVAVCADLDRLLVDQPRSLVKLTSMMASCVERDADGLSAKGDFDGAIALVTESLAQIDWHIRADPDLVDLKEAKLRLLDKAYDIELARQFGRNEGTIRTGDALAAYWLEAMGKGVQLPTGVWVYRDSFTTIAGYLTQEGTPPDSQIRTFRAVRAALAPSLARFADAQAYMAIDAIAAEKLAEVLQKSNQSDPELEDLYRAVVENHTKLGTFDDFTQPDENQASACGGYSGLVRYYKERKEPDRMLEAMQPLLARCLPMVEAHPWDFYLRDKVLGANHHAGELLFELARYSEAKPYLEYASHWGTSDSSQYLSRMYRLGLGVAKDEAKAADLEALSGRQSLKRFTVPADFAGLNYPFHVYVRDWPEEFPFTGIDDQVRWLKEFRGGEVPEHVAESFRRVHKNAREMNRSFADLAVDELGAVE